MPSFVPMRACMPSGFVIHTTFCHGGIGCCLASSWYENVAYTNYTLDIRVANVERLAPALVFLGGKRVDTPRVAHLHLSPNPGGIAPGILSER